MRELILSIASRVIRKATLEEPADAVMRLELKRERNLPPEATREVAEAVFAYYRWKGWVTGEELEHQLLQALRMASRFESDPGSFTDAELVSRMGPDWSAQELELTPELARAFQTRPLLWLRARPGTAPELAQRLGGCTRINEALPDSLVHDGSLDLFRTADFHEGRFELQDITSQAVGWMCAPKAGETWWDACAGEGGKLLHLSDLMENRGLIWATDRVQWRLDRLRRRAGRARVFNYRAALWSQPERLPTRTRFDGILVDAPCSGVGTWHRNPQARWTTSPDDVRELAELQVSLLEHAVKLLKPEGRLFYSVCTLTHAETKGVVEQFERRAKGIVPSPTMNPLGHKGTPSASRHFLWPHQTDGNGMFVASWKLEPPR